MEKNTKEVENTNDEPIVKKGRHRKKQLYNSILQQMEFYFSDSNLTKDRFLSQLIQQNRYVDLNVFLKFNKIRKLTSNVDDIQKAIKKSKLIELSEDKNSICRKEPIKEKINVDECTIYVERLKSDATHEWLQSVFSEFGSVVYTSIPKYKNGKVIKGFAFIEFDKESEAEKALSYFESIGCKMPSSTEPEQLCSVSTFEGSKDNESVKKEPQDSSSELKLEETEVTNINEFKENESNSKNKRKLEETDENNENEENPKRIKTEAGEVSESDDTENKKKKKLKKEHKKKNYIKELGLQVLSKKEWKRMRNRYLDLQRKKMKEFKQHLHKLKYGNSNYENKPSKTNEKPEVKKEETSSKDEIVKGLIVKIKLTEPIVDTKKIKNEMKSLSGDIKYVDVPNIGSEDIYVRFDNENTAKSFCNQEVGGKKEVLTGDEEKAYWDKIQARRDEKCNKAKKKQRGRDKLLKKAKHIKFDE